MSRRVSLFLIPILHQTTTLKRLLCGLLSCSSFQFYIKPQRSPALPEFPPGCSSFQFYIKPQHGSPCLVILLRCSSFQFYIKPQHGRPLMEVDGVVPHSNSTSNHNSGCKTYQSRKLFLIPILHQTTTSLYGCRRKGCCSSFQFYIKPQLGRPSFPAQECCSSFQFYIKPQLYSPLPTK